MLQSFLLRKYEQNVQEYCTDKANEKKQSLLDIIKISLGTTIDSDKTNDSQETILG